MAVRRPRRRSRSRPSACPRAHLPRDRWPAGSLPRAGPEGAPTSGEAASELGPPPELPNPKPVRPTQERIEVDALLAGRYRVLKQLGEGAWAVTWLARDERLDQDRTLKHLRPNRVGPEQVRAEYTHADRLRSRYCAKVYDMLECPRRVCSCRSTCRVGACRRSPRAVSDWIRSSPAVLRTTSYAAWPTRTSRLFTIVTSAHPTSSSATTDGRSSSTSGLRRQRRTRSRRSGRRRSPHRKCGREGGGRRQPTSIAPRLRCSSPCSAATPTPGPAWMNARSSSNRPLPITSVSDALFWRPSIGRWRPSLLIGLRTRQRSRRRCCVPATRPSPAARTW